MQGGTFLVSVSFSLFKEARERVDVLELRAIDEARLDLLGIGHVAVVADGAKQVEEHRANGLLLSVFSYSCIDQLTVNGLFVNFNLHHNSLIL